MPKAIIPLLAVTFVDVLGFSILIPLLPFYAEHFGATPIVVGLLVATVAALGFVSSPLLGALSDRVGRKGILLATQVATTIGYVLLGLGTSLPMIFVARAFEGLAAGGMGVTQAYVSDVTEPKDRARAYGLLGATFGLGFVLGPAIGGGLVRFGYPVPFLTAAAVSLVTIGLTLAMLPESHERAAPSKTPVALRTALREPQLRKLFAVQIFFALAFTMWVTILALFLERRLGFGPSQTSLLYAGSGVIGVLVQLLLVNRAVSRFGERAVLVAGLSFAIVTYIFVGAAHTLAAMIALLFFWSTGSSLVRPTLSALISQAAPAEVRGAILGLNDGINNFAFIVGPIVGTSILMRSTNLVGILPGLCIICGIIAALLTDKTPRDIDGDTVAPSPALESTASV